MNSKIFDFVYNMAMNDATMRNAYLGDKEEVLDKCTTMKYEVKKYIDAIYDAKHPLFYDTASIILESGELEQLSGFTFGNVQKVINMTAKYFYISSYEDEGKRKLFDKCHCSMDRNMINKVVSKYKELIKNDKDQKEKKVEYYDLDTGGKSCNWSDVSWSKLDYNITVGVTSRYLYDKYQEMVKYISENQNDGTEIFPIELDYVLFYDIDKK